MNPKRFVRLRRALSRRQPDLTVLMDQVNKSHNFSAILRNCDAAGVLEVHVVPPADGLDLHHGTSAGTKKWIGINRYPGVADAIAEVKEQGLCVVAAHPSTNSADFRDVDYTKPTAIPDGSRTSWRVRGRSFPRGPAHHGPHARHGSLSERLRRHCLDSFRGSSSKDRGWPLRLFPA